MLCRYASRNTTNEKTLFETIITILKLKNANITNRQNYHKNNYVCIKINGRGKSIAKVWGPCGVGNPR